MPRHLGLQALVRQEQLVRLAVRRDHVLASFELLVPRTRLAYGMILLLLCAEALETLQGLLPLPQLALVPPLLLYHLFGGVGVGPLLEPLVAHLLVEGQYGQLRLLLNSDAADLVHLAHLTAQLGAVLLLILVEAFVRVQVVEGGVGLVGEILFQLTVLPLSRPRQLVQAHFRVDPPLPHLVELGLDLMLPRLVLHLLQLSLPSQPIVELYLLLLAYLNSIHLNHLFLSQQVEVLPATLLLLIQVQVFINSQLVGPQRGPLRFLFLAIVLLYSIEIEVSCFI